MQLTPEQKLCLFSGTCVDTAVALAIDETAYNAARLVTEGVKGRNVRAAGLGPRALRELGWIDKPGDLQVLGLDALDLADASFCSQCIGLFGAHETVAAFLSTPSDAVALAASAAQRLLDVSVEQLLRATAGAPEETASVLTQLPVGAVQGVAIETLLATGVQAGTLAALGCSLDELVKAFAPTPAQLRHLGASGVSYSRPAPAKKSPVYKHAAGRLVS